jgi:hypothetical protein
MLVIECYWQITEFSCWHFLSVSWAYLTTKIITISEFFNFVREVFRLQYEWSSDRWCIWKSFGVNACLQWRNVFSFHWKSVFVQFFCEFFEFIFDCTCTLADQSRNNYPLTPSPNKIICLASNTKFQCIKIVLECNLHRHGQLQVQSGKLINQKRLSTIYCNRFWFQNPPTAVLLDMKMSNWLGEWFYWKSGLKW